MRNVFIQKCKSSIVLIVVSFAFVVNSQAQSGFEHIDLSKEVNQGFVDDVAEDGKGGWTDFGPKACFNNVPVGVQTFEDGIVPFSIIDAAKNDGKAVLVLSGPQREETFPETSGQIKVGKKYSSLYFLHTTMYVKAKSKDLVKYVIHYEDGKEEVLVCNNNSEISDWWEPSEFLPQAVRTYKEEHKWLINTPWKNPFPDKVIEWIQMESTGNAIPILVAVTGSTNKDNYIGLMSVIVKRAEQYELSNLNIALMQIRSQPDQKWNLEKGTEYCRIAKEKGADIALFPEMFNIGYLGIDFDQPDAMEKWRSMAVSQESDFVKHFQELAKELEMAIAIAYLEDIGEDKMPRNSVSLIDWKGNIVFTYAKVHTCEFSYMECATSPGDDFYVKELDTKAGPVKIGMMICYDRESPESARILMLNGAEIILTPNACWLEEMRLSQFRVRAFENAVATVMTNYGSAKGYEILNGRSCIFDADGREVLIADNEEGVYMGTINIHDIRKYREKTIWGNAFRRPHKYGKLVSPDVESVFNRKDKFGKEFKRLER